MDDRSCMIIEDIVAFGQREKLKCQNMMQNAKELKNHLEKEKNRWEKGVSEQH